MNTAHGVVAAVLSAFVLHSAGTPRAAIVMRSPTDGKPRVWVGDPRGEGPSNSQKAVLQQAFIARLKQKLPCIVVMTPGLLREIAAYDRERSLALGHSETIDDVSVLMATDIMVTLDFNGVGAGRFGMANAYDWKPKVPLGGEPITGSGGNWSDVGLAQEMADTVASQLEELREVCPMVGTIEYKRVIHVDTTMRVTEGEAVITTDDLDNGADNWTLTVKKPYRRSQYQVRSSGSSERKTKHIVTSVRNDQTCFPRGPDGTVRDENLQSHVTIIAINETVSGGASSDTLMISQFKLTPQEPRAKVPLWSFSMMAGVTGKGTAYEEDEVKGPCGSPRMRKPAGLAGIPGYVAGYLIGIFDKPEVNGALTGTDTIEGSPKGTVETVTFKLSRK